MKKRLLPLLSVLLLYLTACAASTTAEYISDESGIVTADTTSESVTTELTSTTTPQTTETEVTTEEFTTPFPETTESPPTQPPPPAPVAYGGNLALEVLDLVNAERAAVGLHALAWDENFAYTARIRATEIIDGFYVDHSRPDGSAWYTVIQEAGIGYRAVGENMAKGGHELTGADWYTPVQVMSGWMNSPGHRDNILSGNYDYLGVGIVDYNGMRYYIQHFGAY